MIDKAVIAKRLVELRSDVPRESIAKDIGVSLSALSMYETGQRIPRDEVKLAIARRYGKTVEEIFFA